VVKEIGFCKYNFPNQNLFSRLDSLRTMMNSICGCKKDAQKKELAAAAKEDQKHYFTPKLLSVNVGRGP
jgi:hypothetical protein